MISITYFAGWGICGPLNSAGVSEWEGLTFGVVIGLLGIGALLSFLSKGAYGSKLLKNIVGLSGLVPLGLAIYFSVPYFVDHYFGDSNMGYYEGGVPCDPTSTTFSLLFLGVTVLSSVLFVNYSKHIYRRLT